MLSSFFHSVLQFTLICPLKLLRLRFDKFKNLLFVIYSNNIHRIAMSENFVLTKIRALFSTILFVVIRNSVLCVCCMVSQTREFSLQILLTIKEYW